jgi:hypothetical protein
MVATYRNLVTYLNLNGGLTLKCCNTYYIRYNIIVDLTVYLIMIKMANFMLKNIFSLLHIQPTALCAEFIALFALREIGVERKKLNYAFSFFYASTKKIATFS